MGQITEEGDCPLVLAEQRVLWWRRREGRGGGGGEGKRGEGGILAWDSLWDPQVRRKDCFLEAEAEV